MTIKAQVFLNDRPEVKESGVGCLHFVKSQEENVTTGPAMLCIYVGKWLHFNYK